MKLSFLSVLLLGCICSWAQNVFPSSGNVGVGTTTPGQNLDVVGRGGFSNGIVLTGVPTGSSDINYIQNTNSSSTLGFLVGTGVFSAGSGPYFGGRGNTYSAIGGQRGLLFFSSGAVSSPTGIEGTIVFNTASNSGSGEGPRMIISREGNVGIGTTNPLNKLHIELAGTGGISLGAYNSPSSAGVMRFIGTVGDNGTFNNGNITGGDNGAAGMAIVNTGAGYGNSQDVAFYSHLNGVQSSQKMIIKSDGNVGIGTSTPNYKLSVYGTIGATKVKVTQTGWPDYVFTSDYRLPTLKEVEEYIMRYKHLPDVISAEQVSKGGLDLGKNQAALLKKIEEMTLYMIDIEKKLEAQDQKIEKQAKEIETLKKRK